MIFFLITLFRYFIKLFYSFHYISFPFLKGCRLEKGHIVPVLCFPFIKKKKKKKKYMWLEGAQESLIHPKMNFEKFHLLRDCSTQCYVVKRKLCDTAFIDRIIRFTNERQKKKHRSMFYSGIYTSVSFKQCKLWSMPCTQKQTHTTMPALLELWIILKKLQTSYFWHLVCTYKCSCC